MRHFVQDAILDFESGVDFYYKSIDKGMSIHPLDIRDKFRWNVLETMVHNNAPFEAEQIIRKFS